MHSINHDQLNRFKPGINTHLSPGLKPLSHPFLCRLISLNSYISSTKLVCQHQLTQFIHTEIPFMACIPHSVVDCVMCMKNPHMIGNNAAICSISLCTPLYCI
eukprot:974709_1